MSKIEFYVHPLVSSYEVIRMSFIEIMKLRYYFQYSLRLTYFRCKYFIEKHVIYEILQVHIMEYCLCELPEFQYLIQIFTQKPVCEHQKSLFLHLKRYSEGWKTVQYYRFKQKFILKEKIMHYIHFAIANTCKIREYCIFLFELCFRVSTVLECHTKFETENLKTNLTTNENQIITCVCIRYINRNKTVLKYTYTYISQNYIKISWNDYFKGLPSMIYTINTNYVYQTFCSFNTNENKN